MRHLIATLSLVLACAAAQAEVLVPHSDAEVIETLPAAAGSRAEERRLRQELAANPRDAAKAVLLARRYLDQARSQGDPRPAGQALALLQAWPDLAQAPDDVLLMIATIEQYLHQFDASASHLEQLVTRRPQLAQAWLTLATVRRVQGRYAESDRACTALAATGAALYAQACQAENDGLRGDFDAARARLRRLLASRPTSDSKNWLLTTLAELEARAGRAADADAAYRMALASESDAYTTMSYADFLMQQGRHADALAQLKGQQRTDAVLLRLAIVETRLQLSDAPRDAREMRERMAQAFLRPEARTTHAREQAMFALWVDAAPQRALQLARDNVGQQREPLDLLVLALAARAAGQADALRDAATIRNGMGLHDQRLDALL